MSHIIIHNIHKIVSHYFHNTRLHWIILKLNQILGDIYMHLMAPLSNEPPKWPYWNQYFWAQRWTILIDTMAQLTYSWNPKSPIANSLLNWWRLAVLKYTARLQTRSYQVTQRNWVAFVEIPVTELDTTMTNVRNELTSSGNSI